MCRRRNTTHEKRTVRSVSSGRVSGRKIGTKNPILSALQSYTDSRVGRLLTGTSADTVGQYSADTVGRHSADIYRPTVGRGWLKWTWSHFWWCHLLPFSNVASSMGGNYRIPGHIHTCTWSSSTNQKIFERAFTLTPARLCRTGDKIFFPNIELLVILYSFSLRKS